MLITAYDLTATADPEARTITGTAVPYGVPGNPGGVSGPVVFLAGSLARSLDERSHRVRLVVDHDRTRPVGRLESFQDTPAGLITTWKIASTAAGDAVLTEAAEGIRDGLSVGAEVIRSSPRGGALEIVEARLVETSLVALPAFDSARVSRVAATQTTPGRDPRTLRLRLSIGETHA